MSDTLAPGLNRKQERKTLAFNGELKAVDEAARTITVIVSTAGLDRDEEVILPGAFGDSIAAYLANNPVFLWGHRWAGPPETVIGRCLALDYLPDGSLEAKFEYAPRDLNEQADNVFRMTTAGYIRSFSVGFLAEVVIYFWESEESRESKLLGVSPEWAAYARQALERYARREPGGAWAVHVRAELVEISECIIGSNRDAVLAGLAAGACSREFGEQVLRGLEERPRGMGPEEIRSIVAACTESVVAGLVRNPEFLAAVAKSLAPAPVPAPVPSSESLTPTPAREALALAPTFDVVAAAKRDFCAEALARLQ